MKQRTSFTMRCIALALALVLLVSQANLGIVQRVHAVENYDVNATIAQLVADNYELSDAEEALLKSGYLASESFGYNIPADSLVSVDTENATITTDDFENWKATSAVIAYGGKTLEVALTNGVGTYDAATVGNAFNVQVRYELNKTVATAVQEALLGAGALLKQGVKNLDDVAAQSGNLYILEQGMPEMVKLVKTGVSTPLGTVNFNNEICNAIYALNDQMTANDSGVLNLSKMIAEYAEYQDPKNPTKTDYLVSRGAAMKAEVSTFCTHIAPITVGMEGMMGQLNLLIQWGAISEDTAELLQTFTNVCKNLNKAMEAINADPWTAANNPGLVAEKANYAELDELVAALGATTPVTVKETLNVAMTALQVNMAMWNVTYQVVVNHVVGNQIVKGYADEKTVTLADGAAAGEIAAEFVGFDAEVLNASGIYVEGKYEAAAVSFPETLTKELVITVTYNPVNFTVDIAGEKHTLPYGSTVVLPRHENPAKAYDYYDANGEKYAQGTEVKVEEDMTFTRELGKSYTEGDLLTIIANNYSDEELKKILTSGALLGNEAVNYRKPDPADAAAVLTLLDDVLTAVNYDSDYNGLAWVPYTYGVTGTENQFSGNTAPFTGKTAKMQYRLALTNFTKAEVQAWLDLVVTLETEAAAQISTLDALQKRRGEMAQLDNIKLAALSGVIDAVTLNSDPAKNTALKAEFKAMVSGIIANCLDTDGKLKMYNMLGEYEANGLVYYYKNYAEFKAQLDLIVSYLNGMLGDNDKLAALTTLVGAAGFPEYAEKIKNLGGYLETAKNSLTAPNPAIDLSSSKLNDLVDLLSDNTKAAKVTANTLYLVSDILTVNDQSSRMVQIFLNEVAVGTFTNDRGYVLTAADITGLMEMLNAALADVYGANKKYYEETAAENGKVGSQVLNALVGKALENNENVYFTYSPKTYTVKINGEADQTITIEGLRVNLPAAPAGYEYVYIIDGEEKPVNGTAGNYLFKAEQLDRLFLDGTYTIERTAINQTTEKLENMVATMNAALGDGAAVLVTENGIHTGITVGITAEQFMDFAMSLLNGGYAYIGLNNEGLMYMTENGSLELCMQTLINAMLSDEEFSNATLINLGKNGKGKLMTASMQLGESKTELAYADLAFTINLKSVPAELTNYIKYIETISNYIKFKSDNGVLTVSVNLPDKVYAAYAAALVLSGHVEKDDINGLTQQVAVGFLYDYLEAITGSEMDLKTFTNTINKLGINESLTAYNNYYDKALAAYNKCIEIEIGDLEDENSLPTTINMSAPGKKTVDMLVHLMGVKMDDTLLGMIKEYKDGGEIKATVTAELENLDKTYYGLILDLEASGVTNKVEAPTEIVDLQKQTSTLAGVSAIILTADVTEDLTISGTTVLDLNGFDVKGTIHAKGKLIIIDSSMDTYNAGTVTAVTGNATILAGNYNSDVSSMLMDGYFMDGTTVRNALYKITDDGETISFVVDSNFYENENMDGFLPDVKGLAIDIATDLLLNYISTAKLALGGYEMIGINVEDLLGLATGTDRLNNAVNQLLGCFTLGEAGYENNAGFEGVVNMIAADLLDFAAITDALEKGEPVFNYEMTTEPWEIDVVHNEDGNYATINVTSDPENGKTVNVALIFEGENAKRVAAMTKELAAITEKAEAMVDLPQPTFENKELAVSGAGKAELVLDMSQDSRYATVIGVILANGNPAKKADVAKALNTNNMAQLKSVVDGTSVQEIFTALKKLNRNDSFTKMAQAVGVTIDTAKAAELEGVFHLVLVAAGKVLEKLDIDGMASKLGGLYNAETGYYELTKDKAIEKEIGVRGYSAVVELEVTEITLKVKLFGETCLWGDANHDGEVDTFDAVLVEQYAIGMPLNLFCDIRTDVNADGVIDTFDAVLIRQYAIGMITKFPAEIK